MTVLVKRHFRFFKKFEYDVWEFSLLCLLKRRNLRFTTLKSKRNPKRFKTFSNFYPYSGSTTRYKKIFDFFFLLNEKKKEFIRKRSRRFVYRVDLMEQQPTKKRKNIRFSSLRIIKYFFAILSYKQFRRIAKNIRKKEGFVGSLYVLALEGRLINFLYRSLFTETIFESFFLIKQGYVVINKKVVTYPNATLSLYDILSFVPIIKRRIYLLFMCRIFVERRMLFNTLSFIFVSLKFLYSYMYKPPFETDLPYRRGEDYSLPNRWPIDIYRAAGYAV